jgi:hypothetical protein
MRRQGEVSDADKVTVEDPVLMLLESIERAPRQTGIDLIIGTFCSSESELLLQRIPK